MNRKSLMLATAAFFVAFSMSSAQSIFDFDFSGFGLQHQEEQNVSDKLEFDYDIDFQYYFDNREFGASNDIFAYSEVVNLARISPSAGFMFQQDRNTTHRVMMGVDLTKNLGENPTGRVYYAPDENEESLRNTQLFKDIFYYYNLQTKLGNGLIDLFAGIYPRSVMQGSYSRAFFSDITKITDPNLEGLTIRYRTPKLFAEAGYDMLGYQKVDRRERYLVYTSGEYRVFDWLSAGWAGTYTHIGGSYIQVSRVDDILLNPYAKLDYGKKTGLQELSLKAGLLASMQLDKMIESEPHFPMGAEAIITARKWNAGLENTTFFGDNMMVYKSYIYNQGDDDTSYYTPLLYLGEPFYCTYRGYAAGYDRLELFYEPNISQAMKIRLSAAGHCIFPADESIGWFLGWQARASLVFDLDAIRHPQKSFSGNGDRSNRRNSGRRDGRPEPRRHEGPAIRL